MEEARVRRRWDATVTRSTHTGQEKVWVNKKSIFSISDEEFETSELGEGVNQFVF